jgi:hypothetical protein
MSITSFLADRVREQWSLGVLHLQVARISGNEVVRFFGTRINSLIYSFGDEHLSWRQVLLLGMMN